MWLLQCLEDFFVFVVLLVLAALCLFAGIVAMLLSIPVSLVMGVYFLISSSKDIIPSLEEEHIKAFNVR